MRMHASHQHVGLSQQPFLPKVNGAARCHHVCATSSVVIIVNRRLMLANAPQQAVNARMDPQHVKVLQLSSSRLTSASLAAWEHTRPQMARSDSAQASCAARQLSKVTKQ